MFLMFWLLISVQKVRVFDKNGEDLGRLVLSEPIFVSRLSFDPTLGSRVETRLIIWGKSSTYFSQTIWFYSWFIVYTSPMEAVVFLTKSK